MKGTLAFVLLILCITPIYTTSALESEKEYLIKINFSTTSDWNSLSITTQGTLHYLDHTVKQGEEIAEIELLEGNSQFVANIVKEPYDQNPVKLRFRFIYSAKDPELEITLTKGFIGTSDIEVYGLLDGRFTLIEKISHENVLDSPDTNPYRGKISSEKLEKYPLESSYDFESVEKQVFACYYPWYSTPDGPGGGYNHWDPINSSDVNGSPNYPALDLYDSQDLDVIRTHIRMAKDAGIDGFLCSWSGAGTREDAALNKILDIADEYNFQIGVYYESLRGTNEPINDPNIITEEFDYLLKKYSDKPAYLTADNQPVIFIYQAETQERSPEFWEGVINEIESKFGQVAIIGEFRTPSYLESFQGVHIYNELNLHIHEQLMNSFSNKEKKLDKPWAQIISEIRETGKIHFNRKIRVGTVVPGYDDTEIRTPGEYIPRENLTTYRKYWQNIHNNDLDWVIITSFNEWHEGTEIEPSKEYGFTYLQETLQQIAQYKGMNIETQKEATLTTKQTKQENAITISLTNEGQGNAYALTASVDVCGYNELIPILEPNQEICINFPVETEKTEIEFEVKYFDAKGENRITDKIINTVSENNATSSEDNTVTEHDQNPSISEDQINIRIENFEIEHNGHQITVSASAFITSYPADIEYCSLDILDNGEVIYGECWTDLIENANQKITAPALINYEKVIELSTGLHQISLKSYARNLLDSAIIETNMKEIIQQERQITLEIPEIIIHEIGTNIIIEAVTNIQSNPDEIEYASMDVYLNQTFMYGECWTNIDLPTTHNKAVIAPRNITYSFGFVKPKGPFEVTIKSYARNSAQLGQQKTKMVYLHAKYPFEPEPSESNEEQDNDEEVIIENETKENSELNETPTSLLTHAFEITNNYRDLFGVNKINSDPNNVAQQYAEEMLETNEFKHNTNRPLGTGENVAMIRYYSYYFTPEEAVDRMIYLMMYEDEAWQWGHRANILSQNFDSMSVGVSYDEEYIYLVQNFFN